MTVSFSGVIGSEWINLSAGTYPFVVIYDDILFPSCADVHGTREIMDESGYDIEVMKELEFS